MRVTIIEEYDDESILITLDDGTEVGRYCIVDDAESERDGMEHMLVLLRKEAVAEFAAKLFKMIERDTTPPPDTGADVAVVEGERRVAKFIDTLLRGG